MASPSYSSNIPIPTYKSIGNRVIVPVGKPSSHCLLVPVEQQQNGSYNNNNPWNGAFTKTFTRGNSLSSVSGDMSIETINKNAGGERRYTLISKLGAEFIGTLFLTFIGSLSGLKVISPVLHAAFAHGLVIFVLVSSFGHISGAHFNPAISLAVFLSGKMKILNTAFYWISQLLGGFCGALLVRFVTNQRQYDLISGGAVILPPNSVWYQALTVEIILTTILAQTILTCAVDTSNIAVAPLAIGMTVALDIFAGFEISGASMNPARSLGPNLVATYFLEFGPDTGLTDPIWKFHFIYWVGPLLGGILAALIFRSILTRKDNRFLP